MQSTLRERAKIVRAYEAWLAAKQRAYDETGHSQAETDIDECHDELADVEEAIASTPAHTLAGLMVKARVYYWGVQGVIAEDSENALEGGREFSPVLSIIRDLSRMQGFRPMTAHQFEQEALELFQERVSRAA